jgi:hypothetical protein
MGLRNMLHVPAPSGRILRAPAYTRLDTRTFLGGEKRLSDPQVRALRAIADETFKWSDHAIKTVGSLDSAGLADEHPKGGGRLRVTERGRKALAAIDKAATKAAPAPSIARSEE